MYYSIGESRICMLLQLVWWETNSDFRFSRLKSLFSAIYILLGLALLSMCFSLIQEEIGGKFRWLGKKMGFAGDDGDKDDEDMDEEDDEAEKEPSASPFGMDKTAGFKTFAKSGWN